MWEQFIVFKNSVSAILNRHKVELFLLQEFNELISQIISSISINAAGSTLPHLSRSNFFISQKCKQNYLLLQFI